MSPDLLKILREFTEIHCPQCGATVTNGDWEFVSEHPMCGNCIREMERDDAD